MKFEISDWIFQACVSLFYFSSFDVILYWKSSCSIILLHGKYLCKMLLSSFDTRLYIYFFLSKILNYADDDDDNDDRIATQKLNVFTIDWCCVKNTWTNSEPISWIIHTKTDSKSITWQMISTILCYCCWSCLFSHFIIKRDIVRTVIKIVGTKYLFLSKKNVVHLYNVVKLFNRPVSFPRFFYIQIKSNL